MDLKKLSHLVALAEERNFGRAAARVHLSQSAFSRSVQVAEAELGLPLFDRGTTEVTCTAAGHFVIERARKLLFDGRCLVRDVELYRQHLIGDLAFGVGPFAAHVFLPPLMVELRQRFSGVNVRAEVNHWNILEHQLRREEIDFFVAETRDLPRTPDLAITPLARQHGGFYVRAGHPLLARGKVHPRDMQPFGLASVRLPDALVATVRHLFGEPDSAASLFALQCEDVATLKSVAIATDTVLAATHAAVLAEVREGRLVPLSPSGVPPLYSETGVVSLQGRSHSPMARHVLGRLAELALQLSALGVESKGEAPRPRTRPRPRPRTAGKRAAR